MKVKKIKKQVDQKYVLECIGQLLDDSTAAAQHLHHTLVSLLVDAYDQDLSREAFCNIVITALATKGSHSCATTLRMMRERLHAGVLDDDLIQASIVGNLEYANSFRGELMTQYVLVTECRGNEDTVS